MTEAVGWAAALILLMTMVRQVWSLWNSGAVAGVSRWLFVGQVAAAVGFTIYSVLLGNIVFTLTNGLLTVNAVVGLWIDRRNRRRQDVCS
jgi:MtN3 and saliva related transmembrane protein